MDSYLLKCETTGSEALLASISVTSNLFSSITPHENTSKEIEDTLAVDLNNFKLKEALYCAASNLFLNKKKISEGLNKYKFLFSEQYGDQSIYLMKEEASLYIPDKALLLDGHHRYSVINKYFMEKKNNVPVVFIDYSSLIVGDHYFSLDNISKKEGIDEYLLDRYIYTEDKTYYDLLFFDGSQTRYFILKDNKDMEAVCQRFLLRDDVINKYGFKPCQPMQKGKEGRGLFIAAKAPSKEELLSGGLFPSKSTWITPKFNPELYKEFLN